VNYGVLSEDGAKATLIEGNIFGAYRVTDVEVSIADIVRYKLLAPVVPTNILCVGLNYKRHADECNMAYPERPVLFFKNASATCGPEDNIVIPCVCTSEEMDYECELAVVIGKPCKDVSREEALDYVLGYTCANDVSARQTQFNAGSGQWNRGKSFDTFCPLGPCLVTPEDIPDPNSLRIRTMLNGEVMQDSNTDDMIFDVREIISYLSQGTTLSPGTVIITGTPEGVGFSRKPPVYLKEGDVVTIDIEKIGALTNPVVKA